MPTEDGLKRLKERIDRSFMPIDANLANLAKLKDIFSLSERGGFCIYFTTLAKLKCLFCQTRGLFQKPQHMDFSAKLKHSHIYIISDLVWLNRRKLGKVSSLARMAIYDCIGTGIFSTEKGENRYKVVFPKYKYE